jgi:tetratricopeptide (TPR) repeat protein
LKLRRFIPLVLIAVGIWAYHNSFQGPFILDDISSILGNSTIHHLWPMGTALSPSATSLVGGRPVVNLSLAVNYALGGMSVWGYHAFNLVVHVLAALTLYGIVRRTLLRPALRERFSASGEGIALVVAVIWLVHPLQTEAVTYISQRCESLMGLFYLLTLYAVIRGAESQRSIGWFSLAVAACFLGVASKEVMVTAPLMVLLYDRAFVSGSFREAWTRHRRLYLGLASSWLLLGWLMAGLHERSVGYGLGSTWWGYALTECRVVVRYLRLAVWPRPLILDYGQYEPMKNPAAVVPYVLLLVVLAVVVLFELKWQPAIGFVGAWFFVILAPTSSVVPIAGSPMAEHRMYLPLASVVALAVVGAVALGKRLFRERRGVALGCVAGGSVVLLFTFLTIQRNRDYGSAVTIWQDTVARCPNNPRAQCNLGTVLFQAGKAQDAIGHLERALQIKPDYAGAHYNLGLALAKLGKAPEAISHYEQALRIKPNYADAHNDLGLALERTGRTEEAIAHYEQALRIKPDFVDAHDNLAVALARQGRVPEAIEHWEQALRINPDCADAHYNLALALMGQDRVPEAIDHYELALRINPDYAEAHNNLGAALTRQGRLQEAIGQYEQAVRIKPDYAEARYNLAIALEQTSRPPEAIRQ